MNIWELLANHSHYWGMPHRRATDCRLIQICYECGKEREVKLDLLQMHETAEVLTDELVVADSNEVCPSQEDFRIRQMMLALLRVVFTGVSLAFRK